MRYWVSFCLLLVMFFPINGYAQNEKYGSVIIEAGQEVDKDLITFREFIENKGTINGDLICAGKGVKNSNKIAGDFIAAGNKVENLGAVEGDARIAGFDVVINGSVNKNLMIYGDTVNVNDATVVGRNLNVIANKLNLYGKIEGNATIVGSDIVLEGQINGDIKIGDEYSNIDNKIIIGPNAIINGKLTYFSSEQIDIRPGSKVSGQIEWKKINKETNKSIAGKLQQFFNAGTIILQGLWFGVYLLISMLLIKFLPSFSNRLKDKIRNRAGTSLGVGVITLTVIPILSFLLLITIIGIPISIFLMMGWITLIYLSTVPVALWLGDKLLPESNRVFAKYFLGLLVITLGVLLIKFAGQLNPSMAFLGGIIILMIASAGFGSFILSLKETYRALKQGEII